MERHSSTIHGPYCGISEQRLIREAASYDRKAADLEHLHTRHARSMLLVYRTLAKHRRALLRALRDGRPEAWIEYEDWTGVDSEHGKESG